MKFLSGKTKIVGLLTSRIAFHIYFWLFIFLFIALTMESKEEAISLWKRIYISLRPIAMTILPVYTHFFILERYFYRKKYAKYGALLLVTIFSYACLNYAFIMYVLKTGTNPVYPAFLIIFMILISTSLKVLGDNINQRFLLQEAQAKQVQTELSLLKTQLNPHFLFNTLNNLYGLAKKRNKAASDGIAQLSHLMRYMIYDCTVDKIDLEKEALQIKRLIELQKLRFSEDDDIQINFQIDGNVKGLYIPPMLLIPFVENAFKHGISLKASSFIKIYLNVKGNKLHFSVKNSLHASIKEKEEAGSGVGLQNVRRRLELLYPDSFNLTIHSSDNEFGIDLILDK